MPKESKRKLRANSATVAIQLYGSKSQNSCHCDLHAGHERGIEATIPIPILITITNTTTKERPTIMGHDMYLSATKYLDNFDNSPPEKKAVYHQVLDVVGIASFEPVNSIPHINVSICVADWKNAYHVHKWFVDHVLDGEHVYLRETEVGREQLQQLVGLCKRLLEKKDRKQAAATLPLPIRLFPTEEQKCSFWREAYWIDLEDTLGQLQPLLDNPNFDGWKFFYSASC